MEYVAGTAPFKDQVRVRAFVFDFLSHHARMLVDWAGRTDAAIDRWSRVSGDRQVAAALDTIRSNLREYPPR